MSENKKVKTNEENKKIKETNKKIDYKSELKKSEKEIENLKKEVKELKIKNISLEIELQKNINDFHEKAKTFQSKAQEEINKVKDNLQKHNDEVNSETKKYGAQKLVENLIHPLNNLHLAIESGIKSDNEAIKNYVVGFNMLYNEIMASLESIGVTLIEPKIDDKYDPELHESIHGSGTRISNVKSKGYKLHERVLEPAKVETK